MIITYKLLQIGSWIPFKVYKKRHKTSINAAPAGRCEHGAASDSSQIPQDTFFFGTRLCENVQTSRPKIEITALQKVKCERLCASTQGRVLWVTVSHTGGGFDVHTSHVATECPAALPVRQTDWLI